MKAKTKVYVQTEPRQDMGGQVHHLQAKLRQACQHKSLFFLARACTCAEDNNCVEDPEKHFS